MAQMLMLKLLLNINSSFLQLSRCHQRLYIGLFIRFPLVVPLKKQISETSHKVNIALQPIYYYEHFAMMTFF